MRLHAPPVGAFGALLTLACSGLAPAHAGADTPNSAASIKSSPLRPPSPEYAQRLSIGTTAVLGLAALVHLPADEREAAAMLGSALVVGPATGYVYARRFWRGFEGAALRLAAVPLRTSPGHDALAIQVTF